MTQPDRLTIEDIEREAKFYGESWFGVVYRQFADTLRENERLRDALQNFRDQAWNSLDPGTWKMNFAKADEALSNKDSNNG